MDQIKTGKFIAERRRAEHLTQKQLAERLYISDKTVSKWECGKGLPEVSLMLPLCRILHITVNDLLTGASVSDGDYQKKAEENMIGLLEKNAENKQRFAISVICGVITVIAVCALAMLAAFLDLPIVARVAILLLAAATAVTGILAAILLDVKAGYFECPYCKTLFVPTTKAYVKGYHTLTKRKLTCPECGKSAMCKKRIVK